MASRRQAGAADPAGQRELLSAGDVARTVARIAHQIIEKTALDTADPGAAGVVLLGVPTRGAPLAGRLAARIAEFSGVTVDTGTLDITVHIDSIDFGHEKMNDHAKSPDIFDAAKFPTATFKSKSITFTGDVPTSAQGELTLHGVTKPLTLTINKFKCIDHPMMKREVCGADVTGTFQRSDFGVNYGLPRFSPEVKLAIQVEAVKQ